MNIVLTCGARNPGIVPIIFVIPNNVPAYAGAKSAWFGVLYPENMKPLNPQHRQIIAMTASVSHLSVVINDRAIAGNINPTELKTRRTAVRDQILFRSKKSDSCAWRKHIEDFPLDYAQFQAYLRYYREPHDDIRQRTHKTRLWQIKSMNIIQIFR